MNTPYFLIYKSRIEDNIVAFKTALESYWPNSIISYSVKTNSLPWVLKNVKQRGLFAEVVSDEEYLLAEKVGYSGNNIVFNGPIKGEIVFQRACECGAYINIDSKNDLVLIKKYGKGGVNAGIRVNVPQSIFNEEDIGYTEEGFRFGFSDENSELAEALDTVIQACGNSIGLHLHCNSVTRSKAVYCALAQYAVHIIDKYQLNPTFIDIGVGFFGGVPGKTTPEEYIRAITEVLSTRIDSSKTKLIIEPGSAIIGSAVDLVTSVIDVKKTEKAHIVTTDGSRIFIDPLWKKRMYSFSCETNHPMQPVKKQVVCGYTCMDHDRLMVLNNYGELATDDRIIYHKVGAYTVTFGGMFIRYLPAVYVDTGRSVVNVRRPITVDDYYQIQQTFENHVFAEE